MQQHVNANKELIVSTDDVLHMLDSFLREAAPWWDAFYADRTRDIPFFVDAPDENLRSYCETGMIRPSRVLELGCGPGRNAIYLAQQGCHMDAVDLSREAIDWAIERAHAAAVPINFQCANLFDVNFESQHYDFIYDSGCFHHIAPHRRMDFVELIRNALKPGSYFGLICFAHGEGYGAEISDWEVYRQKSLKGGLAYTEKKLRQIFADFEVVEFRRMNKIMQPAASFGESFLWTVLFRLK